MGAGSPRTVGILGGMGPAATADFYARLVRATPAGRDQDHLPVVVWGDPTVPDRVAALAGTGPSPVPWLVRGMQGLAAAGAQVLAVPCNTAHPFLAEALEQAGTDLELVDMVERTAARAAQDHPGARVGLMATLGTVRHGMYEVAGASAGLDVQRPTEQCQDTVLEVIRGVKQGRALAELRAPYLRAVEGLAEQGCAAVLVACTELSVVAAETEAALPAIDASEVLARETVAAALR